MSNPNPDTSPGPSLNPQIRTSRLLLRPAIPADASGLTTLFSNPATTAQETPSRRNPPASVDLYLTKIQKWRAMRERGENCFLVVIKPGTGVTATTDDTSGDTGAGTVIGIGGINAFKQTPSGERVADVGVAINSSEWGHGYGREAFVATLDYVFGDEAGCAEACWETSRENEPFRALVRKLGLADLEELRTNSEGGEECFCLLTRERWFARER